TRYGVHGRIAGPAARGRRRRMLTPSLTGQETLDSPAARSSTVLPMAAAPLDFKSYPILFVDDEPDIVETFRFGYEDEFTIHSATRGQEALELIRREPIAVLVSDQRMPGMSGLDVITRALDLKPDIVPIILTGFTDLDTLVSALNLGRIHRYFS